MEIYGPVGLDNPRAGHLSNIVAKEEQRLEDAVNQCVYDAWEFLLAGTTPEYLSQYGHKTCAELQSELGLNSPQLPSYTQPPPSYDDAIADVPPEYSTFPPLAERHIAKCDYAPSTPATKSSEKSHSFWKNDIINVDIDFGNPVGVREHKKKKPAAKKAAAPPPPADTGGGSDNAGGDSPGGDGGGDAGGGDAGGDGGGDGGGGGGDDDWNAWTTTGSKKKTKKEEEEEEEARKAAEASAANNLSWADEADDGGGDDWAGFAEVGKKKKGKVGLTYMKISITRHLLTSAPGRSPARWLPRCKPERWCAPT